MQPNNRKTLIARGDMLGVLQSAQGRRVLRVIFAQTNLMGRSFSPAGEGDTHFNEGARAVGIWLKREIENTDPDGFYRLMMERSGNESR